MSEITPEKVAAAVCEGVGGWMDCLEAALTVTAERNVLSLDVTRWDGPGDSEVVRRFRALVVEGEKSPYVASLEFLAAARALFRWNAAASTLAAEQFAALVYEVDDALAALTPEQMAVLAGDDEQAAQAEQSGGIADV